MIRHHSRRGVAAVALAIGLAFVAVAEARTPGVNPRDRARAAQQHPQIVAQFGGAVGGPVQSYVAGVGEKISTAVGIPGQCTYTVISSDVVNAFAVPGCYIYITRGLLAIMNSEDELASVLGHEVGHITANHSSARQTRSVLTGLGAIAVGVLSGNSQLAQLAGQVGQLYTLSYSRAQEFEADDRGVSYLISAGYNPYAAADMLRALGTNDALTNRIGGRAGSEVPAWARTHPMTGDRVTRAGARAQATGQAVDVPPRRARPYLQAINGMIWGDDPEQGFVNGRTFAHPKMRIAFEAPQGFTLTNTSAAVVVGGPNGLRAQFSGGGPAPSAAQGGLDAYVVAVLRQTVGQTPTQAGQIQRGATNGLATALLPARVQTSSGQQADVAVTAYQVGDRAYHFVTLSPPGAGQAFTTMLGSFRTLTEQQAAALRPRRIEAVEVTARDTVQSLAQRMAFTDFQVDRFLALNGRDAATPLRPGETVKLIVWGR